MVKKIFALAICIMVLCSSSCLADTTFNVDDYTTDELASIYSIVSMRVFKCVKVPAGQYIVGVDLPAGTYTVLENDDVEGNTSNDFSHVAVFNNMEEYNKDPNNFFNDDSLAVRACNTLWNGFSCELTDGMVLVVKMGTVGMTKKNKNIFDAFWDN